MFKKIFKNFSGATLVEYSLLATLVVVVCIGSMSELGQSVSNKFHNAAADLEDEEDGTSQSGGGENNSGYWGECSGGSRPHYDSTGSIDNWESCD